MSEILRLFKDDFPDDLEQDLLIATNDTGGLKIFNLQEISYKSYKKHVDSEKWQCSESTVEKLIEHFSSFHEVIEGE